MKERKIPEITSLSLHVMAMFFMLCDHLWASVIPGNEWLTCIGRMAFPIFAFLIVEGYAHTKNLKKYAWRLLLFAVISEVPFNLMVGGSAVYPFHQNVLWTFLISLGLIHLNERVKERGKALRALTAGGTVALGYILGLLAMVDYHHAGPLTVLSFYFFRGRKWWCYFGQLLCLAYINLELLGGRGYEFTLFGNPFFLSQQIFALLSLIPIWLYRGKQGYHSKPLQMCFYVFYPLHLFVLGLLCVGPFNG